MFLRHKQPRDAISMSSTARRRPLPQGNVHAIERFRRYSHFHRDDGYYDLYPFSKKGYSNPLKS
jgi:hypothetical protein